MPPSSIQFQLPKDHPLRPGPDGSVQLPLFMTHEEIDQSHQALSHDRLKWGNKGPDETETDQELYTRKRAEARLRGLAPKIEAEGVKEPIYLGLTPQPDQSERFGQRADRPEVLDGMHRQGVGRATRPESLAPVLFFDGTGPLHPKIDSPNPDVAEARQYGRENRTESSEERFWDARLPIGHAT